jgi:hypothetical protein
MLTWIAAVGIGLGAAGAACKGGDKPADTSAQKGSAQGSSAPAAKVKAPRVNASGEAMPEGYRSTANGPDGKTITLPYTQVGVARCDDKPCLMFTAERPHTGHEHDITDGVRISVNFRLTDPGKTTLSELVGATFTSVALGSANDKPAEMDSLFMHGRDGGRLIHDHGRGAKIAIEAVTDTAIDGQFEADMCTNGPVVSDPCEGKWHLTVKFRAFRDPSITDAMFALHEKPTNP